MDYLAVLFMLGEYTGMARLSVGSKVLATHQHGRYQDLPKVNIL
jgi:hypothetical protein